MRYPSQQNASKSLRPEIFNSVQMLLSTAHKCYFQQYTNALPSNPQFQATNILISSAFSIAIQYEFFLYLYWLCCIFCIFKAQVETLKKVFVSILWNVNAKCAPDSTAAAGQRAVVSRSREIPLHHSQKVFTSTIRNLLSHNIEISDHIERGHVCRQI